MRSAWRDSDIAIVSAAGIVRGLKPGDSVVVAAFNGRVAAARVYVPTGRCIAVPAVPAEDIVDREVYAKLRELGIEPSGPASDSEFLRRITLDVTGTLPTPEEVCTFLSARLAGQAVAPDRSSARRPDAPALWATRYLDITGCDVAAMEGPDQLRSHGPGYGMTGSGQGSPPIPYDPIVRGVWSHDQPRRFRCARPGARLRRSLALREGGTTDYADLPGLDLFWRRLAGGEFSPVEPLAERVATAFLGVRLECASATSTRSTAGARPIIARVNSAAHDGRSVTRCDQRDAWCRRRLRSGIAQGSPGHRNRHQPCRASPELRPSLPRFGPSRSDGHLRLRNGPKPPATPRTLFLMTDAALLSRLKTGRVQTLAASDRANALADRRAPRRPVASAGLGRDSLGAWRSLAERHRPRCRPGRHSVGFDQHA